MAKGGSRPGAGRKPKADEDRIRDMAAKAMVGKYGSEQAAFAFLLESKEPTLIKFAFEHAFGKPKEKVDMNHTGYVMVNFVESEDCDPMEDEAG